MENGAFTIENLSEREPDNDPFIKREENISIHFLLRLIQVDDRTRTLLWDEVREDHEGSDDLENTTHDTIRTIGGHHSTRRYSVGMLWSSFCIRAIGTGRIIGGDSTEGK
jgi:hypothetical protein